MGLIRRVRIINRMDIIIGWVDEVNFREVIRVAIITRVFITEISLYRISVLGIFGKNF